MENNNTQEISFELKKEKRFTEFDRWLSDFQELCKSDGLLIIYSQNASERLNEWYWTRRETDIIPYMEIDIENGEEVIKINHYKIISNLELTIVGFQPILHNDNSHRSVLNAVLAWYIAIRTYAEWNDLEIEKIKQIIEKYELISDFVDEHIDWLTKLDIQFLYPVFSNSHTWWNFDICIELYLGGGRALIEKSIN